jgi:hypothetical protein
MDLDLERWRRLRRAEADAADDGPSFIQTQESGDRAARARDQLARFKAAGPQGHPSGPPLANAHAGEEVRPGFGGHDRNDIERAFERSVKELEARAAAAEASSQRMAERLRECSQRRAGLQRLIADIRSWAAQQTPPVMLPGDEPGLLPPVVTIAGAPRGTHDFLGRPT